MQRSPTQQNEGQPVTRRPSQLSFFEQLKLGEELLTLALHSPFQIA